jgi:hypothetical protein
MIDYLIAGLLIHSTSFSLEHSKLWFQSLNCSFASSTVPVGISHTKALIQSEYLGIAPMIATTSVGYIRIHCHHLRLFDFMRRLNLVLLS